MHRVAIERGGALRHVGRTPTILGKVARWRAARGDGEHLAAIRAVCILVRAAGLTDAAWLVEIEADAVVR